MGADFTAIFPSKLSYEEILDVPNRLHAIDPLVAQMDRGGKLEDPPTAPWLRPWRWRLRPGRSVTDEWATGSLDLSDEHGTTIGFGRQWCRLYHWTRWHTFLEDPERASQVRSLSLEVALLCGADLAIYFPDYGLSDPRSKWYLDAYEVVTSLKSLEEVLDELVRHCGKPRGSLAEVATMKFDFQYFIDRFEGPMAGEA